MSSVPPWGYPLILLGSMSLSLVLVPVAIALATRFGLLDHPGPAKSHANAVPYLGGAAIAVSFAAIVLLAAAVKPPPSGFSQLAALLGLGSMLALVGLVDDLRGGLSPLLRIGFEVIAAVAIWATGSQAHLAGVPSALDALISIAWIVGVTNAFNLLDNMDGLSAGTAAISALAIAAIAALQHRYLVASLAVALAGCAIGFLRANFHPARIYMGDAGSLFLGFTIAVLLLKLRANAPTRVPVAVILAVPGVALFDTTLVVICRLAHRRNPFRGGTDHVSHRLVRLGMSVRGAVLTTYAAALIFGGGAVLMSRVGPGARVAGIVALLIVCAVAAVPLARVPVYHAAPLTPPKPEPPVVAVQAPSVPETLAQRSSRVS